MPNTGYADTVLILTLLYPITDVSAVAPVMTGACMMTMTTLLMTKVACSSIVHMCVRSHGSASVPQG